MVNVAFCEIDVCTKFSYCAFETFGRGDAANRADKSVAQALERQLFPGKNILKVERFVRTLDDVGGAIVTPDPLDERLIRLPRILGDKDIARAPKISRRFAQRAAR